MKVDRPDGYFFITLTAPGEDKLPWDKGFCNHLPSMKCSGAIGCKVDEVALAIWNQNAKQNWSWFMTYLRRELKTQVQFAAAWELQQRGALHRHALNYAPGISLEKMKQAVKIAAAAWGFGVQIDVKAITANNAAEMSSRAGYIVAYITKDLGSVKMLNRSTGELSEGGIRSWSASRRWGVTIAKVKEDRLVWVRTRLLASQGAQSAQGEAAALCALGGAAALETNKEIYTLRL